MQNNDAILVSKFYDIVKLPAAENAGTKTIMCFCIILLVHTMQVITMKKIQILILAGHHFTLLQEFIYISLSLQEATPHKPCEFRGTAEFI